MRRVKQIQRSHQAQEITVSPQSGQWWENYLVRYLVGTVVGAFCIWILTQTLRKDIQLPVFFDLEAINESFYLLVMAIGGFAYCYIASQLVLVVHLWRFAIEFRWMPKSGSSTVLTFFRNPILVIIGYPIATLMVGLLFYWLFPNRSKILAGGWLIAIVCIGLQYAMCIHIFLNHQKLYLFYDKLAEARSYARNKIRYVELIDSYRHMREHGNAFFILFAECIFFGYVYGCQYLIYRTKGEEFPTTEYQLGWSALAAIVWILPGVAAWFIATSIEHKFSGWDYYDDHSAA